MELEFEAYPEQIIWLTESDRSLRVVNSENQTEFSLNFKTLYFITSHDDLFYTNTFDLPSQKQLENSCTAP